MKIISIFAAILFLSACTSAPTPDPTATASLPYRITLEENPYAPRTSDLGKQIAGVTLTSINLSERLDLDPSRVVVGFLGLMPSVCNELRIDTQPPDNQFRIFIEVYSLHDPNLSCDRVFQQFEVSIMLGTYSRGRYTIWVNENLIGDFVTY
jgi:hypothetical protein